MSKFRVNKRVYLKRRTFCSKITVSMTSKAKQGHLRNGVGVAVAKDEELPLCTVFSGTYKSEDMRWCNA